MRRMHLKKERMKSYSWSIYQRIIKKLEFSKVDARNYITNFKGYKTFEIKHYDRS